MKKILITVIALAVILTVLYSCNGEKEKMEVGEVTVYYDVFEETINIAFTRSYDLFERKISPDNGSNWYTADSDIIFTYNKESERFDGTDFNLQCGTQYDFLIKYISTDNSYLPSDVVTVSCKPKKPQHITGDEQGVSGYYSSNAHTESFFQENYFKDGVYDFETTTTFFTESGSYDITFNKCLLLVSGTEGEQNTIKVKTYEDGAISYNENLEMCIYKSSDTVYEPLTEWKECTESNSLSYNYSDDYEIRLLIRYKENDEFYASDTILTVLRPEGLSNEVN